MVAVKCQHIRHEYAKTKVQAFKTSQRLQYLVQFENKWNKDLIRLCKETTRPIKFDAFGFFNVDYSTIFMFVNLIITYVIVIIQFSTQSHQQMYFIVDKPENISFSIMS